MLKPAKHPPITVSAAELATIATLRGVLLTSDSVSTRRRGRTLSLQEEVREPAAAHSVACGGGIAALGTRIQAGSERRFVSLAAALRVQGPLVWRAVLPPISAPLAPLPAPCTSTWQS